MYQLPGSNYLQFLKAVYKVPVTQDQLMIVEVHLILEPIASFLKLGTSKLCRELSFYKIF